MANWFFIRVPNSFNEERISLADVSETTYISTSNRMKGEQQNKKNKKIVYIILSSK